MEASRHSEKKKDQIAVSSEHPVDINDWNKDHVRQWILEIKVDEEDAEIFYNQRINGASLLLLEETDLSSIPNLSLNAKKLIIHNKDLLKQNTQQQNDMVTQSCSLKPYPFSRFNAAQRYRENSILDVTETGPKDLIQPCHEFKAFVNTAEEDRMKKYTYEVIRFAAACMNSRTNGTIHFGVADNPHGQILGICVQKTDDFDVQQSHAIEKHFKLERSVQMAKRCIKPPRFVEVLNADMTSTGKCVIEVDIEPSSIICEDIYFNTYEVEKNIKKLTNKDKMQEPKATGKKSDGKSFFIRDGSSSKNLITSGSSKECEKYIKGMPHLSQLRKDAEEKHLSTIKISVQGLKLCEMITGGTQSLDRSHFAWYIVVANKSHPVQLENLRFLLHMNPVAVLDFDPESAEYGLNKLFEERKINVHLPAQFKITGAVEDIASKLKLTRNTSWVFCNGGISEESPSDADHWLTEKGSSVRDVVSFLCRKDVLPHKKFLTIFLLLSQAIMKETPGMEEIILQNAAKCYRKDPVISQLIARYYYIKKQNFTTAMSWAKKAKGLSKDNSYICDTVSQVLVRELKHAVHKDKDDPIKPDSLQEYLTLAKSAGEACNETQQTANKEAMTRLQRLKDYNTYNTAGHLGELQTAAVVIQILQKTPLFNCLGQVLSGKITFKDLSRTNLELRQYYHVLQKHTSYLLQLKRTMKNHFYFLDNFFVNLVPFFAEKDKQKELTKPKVSRYFQQYADLFCKINWSELVNNERMNRIVKIEQTRQCLERNKGDSYTSLLEYLYEEDSALALEEIIQQYDFILKLKEARHLMDTVNFIYANVILANIKPDSQYIRPYQDLRNLLLQIINYPTPFSEILPLHYITVLLLRQEEDCGLPTFVSQMKLSYFKDLRPVSNGKRAAVHFYLGKDEGYGGLISHRDINSCLGSEQNISTKWDDEKIWKQVRDCEKLCRVSGKICHDFISVADVKVYPMFRSQLHNESGTRVSFFIGFSMNGPVALDIDFES
ncbi:sterile alpha motif domain-containing protein 9-like isoform X2 [Sinocyclocheilus anshuiensis]|uniref:sterile alpha motif domain-containing protein 9-like isoform X2 n=1 Tax=Sinocyclocheilus anshuiensis TaxID=1608454 RepID=UPI0007B85756|nr:PREDICTED: sterile alpha motif domain-containing protein 9-like isoform X2 [Sinocyclocheilus anshuiensis]